MVSLQVVPLWQVVQWRCSGGRCSCGASSAWVVAVLCCVSWVGVLSYQGSSHLLPSLESSATENFTSDADVSVVIAQNLLRMVAPEPQHICNTASWPEAATPQTTTPLPMTATTATTAAATSATSSTTVVNTSVCRWGGCPRCN